MVLTSKHHDGFCLWPSAEANRTWGRPWNSVDTGPRRDLLGDLTRAVRKQGLKMGYLLFALRMVQPALAQGQKRYVVEHMTPQFKDVVSRCAPSIIFSDGEWDILQRLAHARTAGLALQRVARRDVVVINDRWGKEPATNTAATGPPSTRPGMPKADHPWEEDRGMAYSFGYSRTETLEDYRTGQDLVWMLADLVSRGGNLMLDIGPTADGRIPVVMQDRLMEIGNWLAVNGEAIYGSGTWKHTCQWSAGQQPRQGYGQFRVKYDVTKMVGTRPVDGQARKQAFFTTKARHTLRDSAPLARKDVHPQRRKAPQECQGANVGREGNPAPRDCRWQHGNPHAGTGG